MTGFGVALLLLAALVKGGYYFWMWTVTGPTINTATGFTRAQVRLLDTGHTAGTFLTDEFGYQAPLNKLFWLWFRFLWGLELSGGCFLLRLGMWLIFIMGRRVPKLLFHRRSEKLDC